MIRDAMKPHFTDQKTKISMDGLKAVAEYLELYIREAALRAIAEARACGDRVVETSHVEAILWQLLLDF
jgi:hypothetical protein